LSKIAENCDHNIDPWPLSTYHRPKLIRFRLGLEVLLVFIFYVLRQPCHFVYVPGYVHSMPLVGTCVGCVYNTLGNHCAVGNRSWDHGLEMFLEMHCSIPEIFKKVP
jgi:hypothetical protein